MKNMRERFKDLTVIGVDYYMYDDEVDEEYKELNYLCINDKGVYFFDSNIQSKTMVFEDREDAINYIHNHNLNVSICYENIRVLYLEKEIVKL